MVLWRLNRRFRGSEHTLLLVAACSVGDKLSDMWFGLIDLRNAPGYRLEFGFWMFFMVISLIFNAFLMLAIWKRMQQGDERQRLEVEQHVRRHMSVMPLILLLGVLNISNINLVSCGAFGMPAFSAKISDPLKVYVYKLGAIDNVLEDSTQLSILISVLVHANGLSASGFVSLGFTTFSLLYAVLKFAFMSMVSTISSGPGSGALDVPLLDSKAVNGGTDQAAVRIKRTKSDV
jgi:hypothetical protein